MNISAFTRHLYLIPLIPIVVVAALSVTYWLVMAAAALREVVLRAMVRQAGRIFGRRDLQRWLAEGQTAAHRPAGIPPGN